MGDELQGRFPTFFAHSLADKPPDAWQSLETHLLNVANRARQFAKAKLWIEVAPRAGAWIDPPHIHSSRKWREKITDILHRGKTLLALFHLLWVTKG